MLKQPPESFLPLQHPAEHTTIVKIKGCWTKDSYSSTSLQGTAVEDQFGQGQHTKSRKHVVVTESNLSLHKSCRGSQCQIFRRGSCWWLFTLPSQCNMPALSSRALRSGTYHLRLTVIPQHGPGTVYKLPSHILHLQSICEQGLKSDCCLLPLPGTWLVIYRLKAAVVYSSYMSRSNGAALWLAMSIRALHLVATDSNSTSHPVLFL